MWYQWNNWSLIGWDQLWWWSIYHCRQHFYWELSGTLCWFRPRISYLMWCQQPVIKYNVGCWLWWFLPQAFYYIYITNIQNPSSSSNIWNKGFPNGSRSGGGNTIEIKFFRIKYNLNEAINIRFKSYFLHSVSCWLVAVEWPRPTKTIGWCQAESHCFMLFYIVLLPFQMDNIMFDSQIFYNVNLKPTGDESCTFELVNFSLLGFL